jgi:hypothetical protein
LGVAIYTAFAANGHPGLIYAVTLGLNIAGALGFLLLRARHNASLTANQPTKRPSV